MDSKELATELANEFIENHPKKLTAFNEKLKELFEERNLLAQDLMATPHACTPERITLFQSNFEQIISDYEEMISYLSAVLTIFGKHEEDIKALEYVKQSTISLNNTFKQSFPNP